MLKTAIVKNITVKCSHLRGNMAKAQVKLEKQIVAAMVNT